MNMGGPMVMRKDRHAISRYAMNSGHGSDNNLTLGFQNLDLKRTRTAFVSRQTLAFA